MSTLPRIIALTGHKGAGKDTLADLIITANPHAKKFAFADALRAEVCEAFGVPMTLLTDRETKERVTVELELGACSESAFTKFAQQQAIKASVETYTTIDLADPQSPRHIMQWWGQWRRSQDPDYWLRALCLTPEFIEHIDRPDGLTLITDARHVNEAKFVLRHSGIVIRVTRQQTDAVAAVDTHESERGDAFALATHTIHNDGDLDALRAEVERVLAELGGRV